uniref:Ubiquitin-40S ribosomal protein S27a n=1 Tax=Lygus hesperus TaxID=30085 RepID=A0A0A9YPA9_LYGHE
MVQVFVRNVDGSVVSIDASQLETVECIKQRIATMVDVPSEEQHLLYNCAELQDTLTLGSLGLFTDATAVFDLSISLEAGAKKRKRVYTTPKRVKHKGKKIKMRILNCFTFVNDDIELNRLECDRCGAGYYMANHKVRHTCGNCGRTITIVS